MPGAILLTWACLSLAASLQASEEHFEKSKDFDESGQFKEGLSSVDRSGGKPVWSYYYGKSDSDTWYEGKLQPMAWDQNWFESAKGAWTAPENGWPVVAFNRSGVSLGYKALGMAPVTRFSNIWDTEVEAKIEVEIRPKWGHGPSGDAPDDKDWPEAKYLVILVDESGKKVETLVEEDLKFKKHDEKKLDFKETARLKPGYAILFTVFTEKAKPMATCSVTLDESYKVDVDR